MSAAYELDEVADAMLRAIAPAGEGWTLLWAAAPTALLDHASAGTPRDGAGHALTEATKTLLASVGRGRGSTLTLVGDVLFAYEGANPAATLEPVIDAVARAPGRPPAGGRCDRRGRCPGRGRRRR